MASKINADEFVDREGEGKPTLPKGVVLSGVTTITTAVVAENEVANTGGINVGIITSTHFAGNLTGDVNAGIVTVTSQTVVGSAVTISASGIDIGAGVITATSYAGSGANLTGIGATIMTWEYNPDTYDTAVPFDTGIGITFNQKIKAGSGNITLSIANAGVAGTVVENFGIGNSVTISGNSLSFTPTSDLSVGGGQYCITLPSGVVTNMAGESYVGTAYTFGTRAYLYELWSWGYNGWGGLGHNSQTGYSSPVQVPGTTWDNGSGNLFATAAVKTDGTLWTWGGNETGELGQNDRTKYSSPTQVGSDTTWSTTLMDDGVFATKTDGTLWASGVNTYGQLGQNSRTHLSSPVQIPGTTWSSNFIARNDNRFAIKTDGTLWAWGFNLVGGLGLNQGAYPAISISSPVQIPGTTWAQVDAGDEGTIAVKTDGTLWVWGGNNRGQLGQNSTTQYSSPVQIPGTTWSMGATRGMYSFALKTDGTLWGMGQNHRGQLGLNSVGPSNVGLSSPVQIPGTTWSNIAVATKDECYALKTDGTLWSWGYNNKGQLGHNDVAMRSSPTQVPGTTWSFIKCGGSSVQSGVFALKQV